MNADGATKRVESLGFVNLVNKVRSQCRQ